MTVRTKVAIIGSGNVDTGLMIKILRLSKPLEMGAMVGIDAASDGIGGLVALPDFDEFTETTSQAITASIPAPSSSNSAAAAWLADRKT